MKKMTEVSILFSQEEFDTLKTLPIAGRVIRAELDASGWPTGKSNVREWEEAYIVSFKSENTRNLWYAEICYAFLWCGFWRSVGWQHLEEIEKTKPPTRVYTDAEFDQAEKEYKLEMAELKRIGQTAYLAKLDREWRAGWGLPETIERQAALL